MSGPTRGRSWRPAGPWRTRRTAHATAARRACSAGTTARTARAASADSSSELSTCRSGLPPPPPWALYVIWVGLTCSQGASAGPAHSRAHSTTCTTLSAMAGEGRKLRRSGEDGGPPARHKPVRYTSLVSSASSFHRRSRKPHNTSAEASQIPPLPQHSR